jgi:CubicO group peptidase (beta-lactamase class C family)
VPPAIGASLDAVLRAATATRFTAAVARVERGGRLVFEAAYGRLSDTPGDAATEITTRFDLASLTKVFVSTAALRAVDAGELTLDGPLARWLPEWREDEHRTITLRMLLAHTAGLQSGADYRTLFGECVESFALTRPLVAAPGERVVYSDLGFIALGVLLSRIYDRSLSVVIARTAAALRTEDTGYRPRNDDPWSIAATERDDWRGRVRGSVHDEKAHLMGGVAGHAGLFGTARDVAMLAEAYLGSPRGRASVALRSSLAAAAVEEHGADPVLRRGLGWALKTSDDNSCGASMHRSTFGHTGFTGTCVWADPIADLSVVLLTNAVYFGRGDLRDVRAAVCDAAMREFA